MSSKKKKNQKIYEIASKTNFWAFGLSSKWLNTLKMYAKIAPKDLHTNVLGHNKELLNRTFDRNADQMSLVTAQFVSLPA